MLNQLNRRLFTTVMCVVFLSGFFYTTFITSQNSNQLFDSCHTIIVPVLRLSPPIPKKTVFYAPFSAPLHHPQLKIYTFEELKELEKKHPINRTEQEMSGGGFTYKNGTLWNNGKNLSHVDDEFAQEDYEPITFISVVVNEAELAYNLLKSPAFTRFGSHHQWIIYNNKMSKLKVPQLYNDAWKRAVNDLLIFIHPDVWLGDSSLPFIYEREIEISSKNISWGALGTLGFKKILKPDGNVQRYTYRGQWCEFGFSYCVNYRYHMDDTISLDEMLFIMRKKTNITFDPNLPGNHLYGTDLCTQGLKAGYPCHSLSSHVFHKFRTDTGVILNPDLRQKYHNEMAKKVKAEMAHVAQYLHQKWKGKGVFPIANGLAIFQEESLELTLLGDS